MFWEGARKWGILFGILVGSLSLYSLIRPKPDVSRDLLLDKIDPFVATFVIANNSLLTMKDVEYSYAIDSVLFENGLSLSHNTYGPDGVGLSHIDPGKRQSVRVETGARYAYSPIVFARFKVSLQYSYLLFHCSDEFGFQAYRHRDGHYEWGSFTE
jgi:hypothetical protein